MLFDEADLKKKLATIENDFEEKLKELRTDRVSADLFKRITVNAYGMQNPFSAMATLAFDQGLGVKVRPFDPASDVKKSIENALKESLQSASIQDQGEHIQVNFLPLTEEVRAESAKTLGVFLIDYKDRVRGARRKFMEEVKSLEGVSEDLQKSSEKRIQDLVDQCIVNLDRIASTKRSEIIPSEKK